MGAAGISVSLSLTSDRFNFGPSLSLQYSSSARNSVYEVGWALAAMPTIVNLLVGSFPYQKLFVYRQN